MSLKMTNYAKIENIKTFLVEQIKKMGFEEQSKVITEKDLEIMIYGMAKIGTALKELESEGADKKMDYLILYIISLWAKLIIDHGAGPLDI